MSKDEFQQLLLKYNLQMKYRRSNSDDGYISFGEMSVHGYTTYISFVMRDSLTELNFYDYYVQTKYGLSIVYIGEDQTSSGSGSYEKAGYYIVGGETPIYFSSASDAINELHSNRMK